MKRYLPEHLTQNLPTNNDLTSWVPFFKKIHVSEKLLRKSFADTPLPNLRKLYENCAPAFHTDICPDANWQLYALTEDLAFIEKLLNFSAQTTDRYGRTILDYAAYSGSPDAITAILEKFPELAQHTTNHGNNILHFAALSGSPDAIIAVLEKFPELAKSTTNDARNILHSAAWSGSSDAITTILDKFPELAKNTTNTGLNILHYAAWSGAPDAITFILDKYPELAKNTTYYDLNILHFAAWSGSPNAITTILNKFPELKKSTDIFGASILNYAARSGFPAAIIAALKNFNEVLNETLLAVNKNTPPTEKQIALINAFHQEVDDYLKNKDNKIPADELKRLKKGKKAFDLLKIENLPPHTIELQLLEKELKAFNLNMTLFNKNTENAAIMAALTELIKAIKSTKRTVPDVIHDWQQHQSNLQGLTNAELIAKHASNSTKILIDTLSGPAPKPKSIEFDL